MGLQKQAFETIRKNEPNIHIEHAQYVVAKLLKLEFDFEAFQKGKTIIVPTYYLKSTTIPNKLYSVQPETNFTNGNLRLPLKYVQRK